MQNTVCRFFSDYRTVVDHYHGRYHRYVDGSPLPGDEQVFLCLTVLVVGCSVVSLAIRQFNQEDAPKTPVSHEDEIYLDPFEIAPAPTELPHADSARPSRTMRAPPQYVPYAGEQFFECQEDDADDASSSATHPSMPGLGRAQSVGEVSTAASTNDVSDPDLPPLQHDSDADSGTDDDGSSVSSSGESHPFAQAFRALIRRFAGDSSECEIFHIDDDDSDDAPDFAHPAYTEETEFAYTDKLAPLWNGSDASYLKFLRTLKIWKLQAHHLTKEPPAPEQTAGMIVGRIRGGKAQRWVEDHADIEKMSKADGEEYVLKELAALYEKSSLLLYEKGTTLGDLSYLPRIQCDKGRLMTGVGNQAHGSARIIRSVL